MNIEKLRINADRLRENFDSLSRIGGTPGGGVHRPTFSKDHREAREWFRGKVESAGLAFQVDGAGNHSAILLCGKPGAPTLLLGSHLDSVPNGGRFDGAFGVLSALEVLQTILDSGFDLPFHVEAIDFTDEEGTYLGLLGSRALTGHLTSEDLERPRGGRQAFLEGLDHAGLEENGFLKAARNPENLVGYLELHIEQGERLVQAGAAVGVVNSIIGLGSYRIRFIGRADHAGTTPMRNRHDAAQGAAAFTLAAHQLVLDSFPDCTVNIGRITFEPGAFNIVPGEATLALEFRAPAPEMLNRLENALLASAQEVASRYGLSLEKKFLEKEPPAFMNENMIRAITESAESLGLQVLPMPSYAGHDAQALASICPAGMIFIPSVDGASHSPREFSHWEDCLNGANVLLQVTLTLVDQIKTGTYPR